MQMQRFVKQPSFKQLIFSIILLSQTFLGIAQVNLSVIIDSGTSNSTCTDGFLGGGPELHWRVDIESQGFTTYPQAGICFNNTPNTQYSETFNCDANYPDSIQICFRAFEDDGAACVVSQSCLEEICQNFATPISGTSYTDSLEILNDGVNDSWGKVVFTINATGALFSNVNDTICGAINLGTLTSGSTIGDNTISNYQNFCATNTNDQNPIFWTNNQGVWFEFTTGPVTSTLTTITAISDPSGIGDDIDLQLALFESSNNTCTGTLTYVASSYAGGGIIYNENIMVNCLQPNTTYYILVDGEGSGIAPGAVQGYFGIEVTDAGQVQAGDEICDAEDLGTVPNGGSVSTPNLSQSNICATNTNDPTVFGIANNGVWYQFQAPASGHVTIGLDSDLNFPIGLDAIDLQLGVFQSSNGTCTGTLTPIDSSYTAGFFDEDLTISCLFPGQPYWVLVDGSALNATGIFDITVTDAGTAIAADSTFDVQTACDSLTWVDGITYTTSNNTASMIYTNQAGCDSIVTLNLTIVNTTFGTDIITACDSLVWIDGNTYFANNNTATDTLVNSVGCDSIVTLNLTILNTTFGTDLITACDSYTWIDGVTYTTNNNTATDTLTNASGCDSVVTLDLTILSTTFGTDVVTACGSYIWTDGITYTANNNSATDTLINSVGCDSIITLDLTILNNSTGSDVVTACGSYTWTDGVTYTASNNTATDTLTNAVGCDSIITLDLTILSPSFSTDVVTVCDTYTWMNGVTYTMSNNIATDTLVNAIGCDSIITLNLTILNTTFATDVITACDSLVWIDGNTYFTNNNTATDTLTNMAGCDSIITLDLTINNTSFGTDVISACDSLVWIDGNTYYANNNTAIDTLISSTGCDSIVTLNLTITSATFGTDIVTACETYIWTDGNTYTANNNTATDTLTNASGCDSIITLNLTILNSSAGVDVVTACDSYTWIDGITYTSSNNTATTVITNTVGCDSTVTLDLTILNSSTRTDPVSACDQYTWIDGVTYTEDNSTATYVLTNSVGCDSIITLDLVLNKTVYTTDQIIATDTYTWINGVEYTSDNATASYVISGGASSGCDSVILLDLTIERDFILYAPSAFSPGDNGFNNEWRAYVEGIDIYDYSLRIFNRWGEIIWESFDPEASWDGKYANQFVESDAYVWMMQFQIPGSGNTHQYSGHVSVIR